MQTETISLGPTPQLTVNCQGNLEISGSAREEIKIEHEAGSLEVIPGEKSTIINCAADCVIRMPQAGTARIGQVGGNFHARDIDGELIVDAAHGSFYARRVGKLRIGRVEREARIREAGGSVTIGHIGGSLALRDTVYPVYIEEIGGDLWGRNVSGGLECDRVAGTLALRTPFPPGITWRVGRVDQAIFQVDDDDNVRFVLASEAVLQLAERLNATWEGNQWMVLIGSGASTVHLLAVNHVALNRGAGYDEGTAFAYSFAVDDEPASDLADLSAELDTQYTMLEASLSDSLSERLRHHIAEQQKIARRQVEDAHRTGGENQPQPSPAAVAPAGVFGREGSRLPREPVGGQEQQRILQMLASGRMTIEQAAQLLKS
jgi:hypothetical protein